MTYDLDRITRALKGLDRLALQRFGQLPAGPPPPEAVRAWEQTLQEMETTMDEETKQIGIRLPVSLLEQIDGYARWLSENSHGLKANRADAARVLLQRGLEAVSSEMAQGCIQSAAKPKKKTRRR